MDYYSDESQNRPPEKVILIPNLFLLFSTIFAILSLMCSCFAFSAYFFGALSIIFAVLSKGHKKQMVRAAKTAVFISAMSIVFSTITTTVSVYQVLNNPEMYQEYLDQYENMTGVPIQEEIEQFKEQFPILFDDAKQL